MQTINDKQFDTSKYVKVYYDKVFLIQDEANGDTKP